MEESYITVCDEQVFINTKRELSAEECKAILDQRTQDRTNIMQEIRELAKNEVIQKYDKLLIDEASLTDDILILKERLGIKTPTFSSDVESGDEVVSLEEIVTKSE